MKSIKVVICGAGIAGKRELVDSIAKITGAKPKWVRHRTDVTVHCSIESSGCAMELVSFTGAIVYFNELVPTVLSNADAVVYVITCWKDSHETEVQAFENYRRVTATLRKSWDDIQWLTVVNKMDLGDPRKALEGFKEIKSKATFFTNAKTGEGVPEFWEGLQRTIRAIP